MLSSPVDSAFAEERTVGQNAARVVEPGAWPSQRFHRSDETLWWRCCRRLHLLKPGHSERHRPWEPISETRDGVLHLCGEPVA